MSSPRRSKRSVKRNSPPQSASTGKTPTDIQWDWAKLYDVLDTLTRKLRMPGESLESYHEAIRAAREVETQTVMVYSRISRHLAGRRKEVSTARFNFNVRLRQLMTEQSMNGMTQKERRMIADTRLVEEQKALDDATDRLNQVTVFLDSVRLVLSTCKHTREDFRKKISILEIEYGLKEQP